MKVLLLTFLVSALLVQNSLAVSAVGDTCSSTATCSGTVAPNCIGGTVGSSGTCQAACSTTLNSKQCVLSTLPFCNSATTCVAAPTCTASTVTTTCTDSNNAFCVGTSSSAVCGPSCSAASGTTTQCIDNSKPYCSTSSACVAAPTCTASSTCADVSNAQCINGNCAATCNHNTGKYCIDTSSASGSQKIYCTSSNVCAIAIGGTSLTTTASIPANCAVGTSATVCTACKPGYGLSVSGSATSCVACYVGCLDCINGASNSSCISYKWSVDGSALTSTTQAQANCTANYTPGAVQTGGTYTCYACSTNCTACTSPNTASPATANNTPICQTCAAYSYGNGSVTLVNTSATSTPVTWYYNCIGCPANCSSCTNSTYCLKCNGTLTWNNSTKKCFGAKISSGVVMIGFLIFAAFSF